MRPTVARICLFLSGFAGLVYEVCWIRQGALVFGSTTLSTSTVVAVFFAGLALGSHVFGRLSARVAHPMRWYAAVELVVAALGVSSLWLFPVAEGLYGSVYRTVGEGSARLLVTRAVLISVILLPPAFFMGATLPLVCSRYAVQGLRTAGSAGVFYALNTLGAALGCAATGLLLIPGIGISRSIALAAAVNLVAAVLAALLPPAPAPASESTPAPAPAPRAPARPARATPSRPADARLRVGVVASLFFTTGFVALAHEVLWTRYLGLLLRNTVYTYTVSLTVVLAGIVIGSLLVSRLALELRSSARLFGALQIATGLYVLVLMLLPPAFWGRLGAGFGATFVLLLPPTIFSGASFPLALRMVMRDPARVGYEVGRMTAVNIVGGIVGSLLMGFIGLPRLGLQASVMVTTALSVAAGVVAWAMVAAPARRARDLALAALPVAAWIAAPFALRTRIPQDFLTERASLVAFREGLTSNVAVVRTNEALQLEIDRWWQGQDSKTHQIMAAHVPMLLHPDPRAVLVVGAGTGQTASRYLLHPIERLDVVDIEPAVFDLIRDHFDRRWLDDPRVRLVHEDGRNHVAHAGVLYDVVSLEVGQVFRPGVASFYTAEFYARARRRLRPGGVVCQFVPLPFLTGEQFRGIVATFIDAFPGATLWYNTSELLLIGTPGDRLALRDERLALLSTHPGIHDDLRYSPWGGPAEWLNRPTTFLGGFLCGRAGLESLARGAPRYRDDRPVLEYATSGADETLAPEIGIVGELRDHLDPIAGALARPWPADSLAASLAMREANLSDIVASARMRPVAALAAAGRQEQMLPLLSEALRINPRSVQAHRLMADALVAFQRWPEAREHYETALRLRPGDHLALRGLATWHLSQRQLDQARPLFETLLEIAPGDAEAHNNYGVLLIGAGDVPGAIAQFREALRLRPGYPDALRNLGRAEWGQPSSP